MCPALLPVRGFFFPPDFPFSFRAGLLLAGNDFFRPPVARELQPPIGKLRYTYFLYFPCFLALKKVSFPSTFDLLWSSPFFFYTNIALTPSKTPPFGRGDQLSYDLCIFFVLFLVFWWASNSTRCTIWSCASFVLPVSRKVISPY